MFLGERRTKMFVYTVEDIGFGIFIGILLAAGIIAFVFALVDMGIKKIIKMKGKKVKKDEHK